MITLAITTHNRPEKTIRAFEQVLNDDRISEVLIIDDCSDWNSFLDLRKRIDDLRHAKVTTIRNSQNLGCFHNKHKAVKESSNEWVILLDSDNIIDSTYLDALHEQSWQKDYIYAPEFAKPHFDYRAFSGKTFDSQNVKEYIKRNAFDCLFNTCNYFFNRVSFLESWVDHNEPWTADTLWINYHWLKAGKKFFVVPGMQYSHEVHKGSHYQNNIHKTKGLDRQLMDKLSKL